MDADPSIGDLNEQIAALIIELQAWEDWHSTPDWQVRDKAIREEIHRLRDLRDLLPP